MATRKSRVLHRSLRDMPPKAIGGEGIYLIAEDGRRVIDASGGAAVSCLGGRRLLGRAAPNRGPARLHGSPRTPATLSRPGAPRPR